MAWAFAVALLTVGAAAGQNALPAKKAAGKIHSKIRNQGGVPLKKALPNAADPLAKPAPAKGQEKDKEKDVPAPGTFHYKFKMTVFDGTVLNTHYYPSRLGTTAPVVLMVHEKDSSGKVFEDPIPDLKGRGLAEYLQSQNYAVLIPDLRGHGANPRRSLSPKDWALMVDDLQACYQFLLDRHNRGELNVAKLGILALGEGANLAAAWLALPGGAVASEGRVSDASALALISPLADGEGFRLNQVMAQLANRVPVLLMVGEKDQVSSDPVHAAAPTVKRTGGNKVELKPSSLHGYKLLKLEPGVTSDLSKFFDGTVKYKSSDWEPRYNLNPVAYIDIEIVRHTDKAPAPEPKKEAEAPKAKEKEKEKAKDAAKKGEAP